MRCAVIDTNGVVVNIIMAEPSDLAPLGCFLVAIPDAAFCDIGWVWDGTAFVNPNPPQPDSTDG